MNQYEQKAKEIVEKYMPHAAKEYAEVWNDQGAIKNAKQCALIEIDSHIQECKYLTAKSVFIIDNISYDAIERIKYWLSVKEAVEKY